MKRQTVNVIQYLETVSSIHSWDDDEQGNKKAEDLFSRVAKENDPTLSDNDINACLDNGVYTEGEFEVYITHSE